MLNRRFINNVRRGLGAAYLEILNAEDKQQYKESLVYCITHSCTYEFIFEGSKGDYLYKMIELYEDKSYFLDVIKSSLYLNKFNVNLNCQLLDLLMEFYYDGFIEVKEFLKKYYNHILLNDKWTEKIIKCYDYLCIKISNLFGLKEVIRIINDIEAHNIDLHNLWFCLHISLKYKNNNFIKNKTNINMESKNYSYTFSEFLELLEYKKQVYCFSSFATKEEYHKCEEYLKTSSNETLIRKILKNQQTDFTKFKINESILFGLIDKFSVDLNLEIYNTLAYYKSDAVELLGLKFIDDSKYFKPAIHMLMTNYKKEYKDILTRAYKKIKFSFNSYESITSKTIDFMFTSKNNMPDEILYYTYYNDYCAFNREYIVKCMNKRKLLTESIKNELQYDSDCNIRNYYDRYIKNN